jgi:magnesium-transporting ATPase (P-type)
MQEEKEAHLLLLFCYNTNNSNNKKKFKKKSFYCIFLATIFHLFVACNYLVTWNKKKKHTHASFSCYNISYIIIIFVFLFNSFVFLVAMLLDASLNSPQGREMNPQMTIMELR